MGQSSSTVARGASSRRSRARDEHAAVTSGGNPVASVRRSGPRLRLRRLVSLFGQNADNSLVARPEDASGHSQTPPNITGVPSVLLDQSDVNLAPRFTQDSAVTRRAEAAGLHENEEVRVLRRRVLRSESSRQEAHSADDNSFGHSHLHLPPVGIAQSEAPTGSTTPRVSHALDSSRTRSTSPSIHSGDSTRSGSLWSLPPPDYFTHQTSRLLERSGRSASESDAGTAASSLYEDSAADADFAWHRLSYARNHDGDNVPQDEADDEADTSWSGPSLPRPSFETGNGGTGTRTGLESALPRLLLDYHVGALLRRLFGTSVEPGEVDEDAIQSVAQMLGHLLDVVTGSSLENESLRHSVSNDTSETREREGTSMQENWRSSGRWQSDSGSTLGESQSERLEPNERHGSASTQPTSAEGSSTTPHFTRVFRLSENQRGLVPVLIVSLRTAAAESLDHTPPRLSPNGFGSVNSADEVAGRQVSEQPTNSSLHHQGSLHPLHPFRDARGPLRDAENARARPGSHILNSIFNRVARLADMDVEGQRQPDVHAPGPNIDASGDTSEFNDSELASSESLPSRPRQAVILHLVVNAFRSDDPLLHAPSLFTDNPTYEDMLRVQHLLGEVKPPTASQEAVEAAGGLETLGANSALISCNERCSVCLSNYATGDVCRTLGCMHHFHQSCVDQWLTRGNNACPLCRNQGVPDVNEVTS